MFEYVYITTNKKHLKGTNKINVGLGFLYTP